MLKKQWQLITLLPLSLSPAHGDGSSPWAGWAEANPILVQRPPPLQTLLRPCPSANPSPYFTLARSVSEAAREKQHRRHCYGAVKLFVFRDSYADTGNCPKPSAVSWKEPYGFTFLGTPAGRFSDGGVLTDYIGVAVQYKPRKMEFCPTCGLLLQYELPHLGRPARFFCPTCPYVCHIESKVKIKRRQHLVRKEIEPIFSKDDMKNGPTTEATCPNCGFGKAVFQQLQIRSADEPMSTFYWCLNEKCGHQWRED